MRKTIIDYLEEEIKWKKISLKKINEQIAEMENWLAELKGRVS